MRTGTTPWSSSSATSPTPSTSASSTSTTVKEFSKNANAKNALFNWDLGAVIYLIAGRFLERIIRP